MFFLKSISQVGVEQFAERERMVSLAGPAVVIAATKQRGFGRMDVGVFSERECFAPHT